jgi:uncharacterized protein (DUF952 family)
MIDGARESIGALRVVAACGRRIDVRIVRSRVEQADVGMLGRRRALGARRGEDAANQESPPPHPGSHATIVSAFVLFHITTELAWAAARETGKYRAASLETEGFIHLSTGDQWPRTLVRWFPGRGDLVLLTIDPARLEETEVRYEPAHGEDFPHLFGALPIHAVIEVRTLVLGADGLHRASARETMPR